MYPTRTIFPILILTSLFTVISSDCRKSFMTVCDNFEDFQNFTNTDSISELVIGSENGKANMTSVHLMNVLQLQSYPKLKSIIVIRAINKIESTYGYQCTYFRKPLQYIGFYGNELKIIESYQFPLIPVKKMSLVGNNIEEIKGWGFRSYDIEELDLSDNFLEVVQSESLPLKDTSRIVTIRNNKLTHIEPGSFSSKLEVLNLDNNKLRYVEDQVLDEIPNLKELTLSHNKFKTLPKITHLNNLVIFDISFNSISSVKNGTFKNMDKLKFVDLSNNEISNTLIIDFLQIPKGQVTISLAMNRLRQLDLGTSSLDQKTLVLYGNPWDCNTWPNLKKRLEGHESECDAKYLSNGSVPYCINYLAGDYVFTSLWEQDIDRFHEVVRSSEKKSRCTLTFQRTLESLGFGCVA